MATNVVGRGQSSQTYLDVTGSKLYLNDWYICKIAMIVVLIKDTTVCFILKRYCFFDDLTNKFPD
jgi:hypothetical protein